MCDLKGILQNTRCRLHEVLFLNGKSVINEFEEDNELQFDSFRLSPQRIDPRIIQKADYKLQVRLQYLYLPACVPNEGQLSFLESDLNDLLGLLHDDASIKLGMVQQGGYLLVQEMDYDIFVGLDDRLWHLDKEWHWPSNYNSGRQILISDQSYSDNFS